MDNPNLGIIYDIAETAKCHCDGKGTCRKCLAVAACNEIAEIIREKLNEIWKAKQ